MSKYTLSAVFKLHDKFTGTASKINLASRSLGLTTKNLGNGLESLANKFSSLQSKGVTALKMLGVAGTGALIGGLKVASDYEALSARMETAFKGDKEKAKEYYKWANKFADSTPFSNEEVVGVTAKLSMQGYDPKKIMNSTGNNLLTLLGDMSGAMGKTLDQAYEAFDDVKRGEWERLKEMGISKSEVEETLKKMGLSSAIDKKGTIKDANDVMDALVRTINKKYGGGMEKLANTLKGKFSTTFGTLRSSVARFFGIMDDGTIRSGSLVEKFKGKLDKINKYFSSSKFQEDLTRWTTAFDTALTQIKGIMQNIVKYFEEKFPNIIKFFTEDLNNVDSSAFNGTLENIKNNVESLIDTFIRLQGIITGAKLGALFGPLGTLVGAGVGALTPEILDVADYGVGLYQNQKKKETEYLKLKNEKNTNKDYDVNFGGAFKGKTNSTPYGVPSHVAQKQVEVKIDMSNMKIDGGVTETDVKNIINTAIGGWELKLSDNLNLGGAF